LFKALSDTVVTKRHIAAAHMAGDETAIVLYRLRLIDGFGSFTAPVNAGVDHLDIFNLYDRC
jgi:hypothetical protein